MSRIAQKNIRLKRAYEPPTPMMAFAFSSIGSGRAG